MTLAQRIAEISAGSVAARVAEIAFEATRRRPPINPERERLRELSAWSITRAAIAHRGLQVPLHPPTR